VAESYHLLGRCAIKVATKKNEWAQTRVEQADVWAKIQAAVSKQKGK